MSLKGKEVKFRDKYERVLEGVVIDDNYTLPYGGPIVDGEVTDLKGLVKVISTVGQAALQRRSYSHTRHPGSCKCPDATIDS